MPAGANVLDADFGGHSHYGDDGDVKESRRRPHKNNDNNH